MLVPRGVIYGFVPVPAGNQGVIFYIALPYFACMTALVQAGSAGSGVCAGCAGGTAGPSIVAGLSSLRRGDVELGG